MGNWFSQIQVFIHFHCMQTNSGMVMIRMATETASNFFVLSYFPAIIESPWKLLPGISHPAVYIAEKGNDGIL